MKISDVDISILIPPFVDNPLSVESIGLSYTQEKDTFKFEIPPELYWLAKISGIKITYTQELTNDPKE